MGAWTVASIILLAVLLRLVVARRRAAQRQAALRARSRARRNRAPLVSANLRGLAERKPDIWREERDEATSDERVA